MRTITVLCALALAGCAGSEIQASNFAMHNHLMVFEGDGQAADYKVYLKNFSEVGYDAENAADRRKLLSSFFSSECPSINVVDERFLSLGRFGPGGGKRGTYIMQVKCNR